MGRKTMTLAEAEVAQREAWEADRRERALRIVRKSVPKLEQRVEKANARIAELQEHLDKLVEMRDAFAKELADQPQDTRDLPAQEEDQIRSRRKDLRDAIAALEGAEAMGTLVDHLRNQPRIPGMRRRIAEEREQLVRFEGNLAAAQRQLNR